MGRGITGNGLNPLINGLDRNLLKQLYSQISKKKSIHTVIIAHKGGNTAPSVFVETFDHFMDLGKEVVYVLDIPRMPHPITSCFDSRPLRLWDASDYSCIRPKASALAGNGKL